MEEFLNRLKNLPRYDVEAESCGDISCCGVWTSKIRLDYGEYIQWDDLNSLILEFESELKEV